MKYRSSSAQPMLPQRTRHYLENGAPEGQRNAELFDAACQLRDASISKEQAQSMLITRALSDGLSEAEAAQTIDSAFAHAKREALGAAHAGVSAAPAGPSHAAPKKPAHTQPTDKPRPDPMPVPAPLEGGFIKLL